MICDAHRLVKLNLTVGKVSQHFLHLCFLCILEHGLLTESFITESIRGFVRCSNCILKLKFDK